MRDMAIGEGGGIGRTMGIAREEMMGIGKEWVKMMVLQGRWRMCSERVDEDGVDCNIEEPQGWLEGRLCGAAVVTDGGEDVWRMWSGEKWWLLLEYIVFREGRRGWL